MTSHNSFFGWVHGFKINQNNLILGAYAEAKRPFPALIPNPTIQQCIKNWNTADTGLVLFVFLAGTLYGWRHVRLSDMYGLFEKRSEYFWCSSWSLLAGVLFGLRNSFYRLEGLVPNGLPANEVMEPVKYDYTSSFLNKSFWSFFFEENRKPSQ